MADTQTTVYGLIKPEVGASEDTWGSKINGSLDALDDLLSGSTTLQGAKLDDTTKIVDNADATKIVALSAGSLTTATTRTFTFPDATGTFVLADNTATLTNKTLTSPAINTGFTFDGTTVTALSGADTTVVTGTAGTSGNVATWNADGDVVDGGSAPLVQTTGTFTPTFQVDAGTFTASSAIDMSYWRIGNIVHLQGQFILGTVSGVSGATVRIVGLPYSFSKDFNGFTTINWLDQSGTTGLNYTVLGFGGDSTANTGVIRRSASSFAATDRLWFSAIYPTDDAV